jgi:predicted acyltransferase
LTKYFPFWTTAFDSARPFGSLFNPNGDWLKPWVIHCRPWLSISYGTMAMIGVLLGDALATKNQRLIVTRGLLVALGFMSIGYAIHKIGFVTGQLSLCMSKPDVTTSYAFFTSGLGALTYIGFYYLIDVWKINLWAWPLMVFGMNPLLAYFTQILMRRAFESLGIIGFFNLPTADNTLVMNWAMFFGVNGQPSPEVLHFFAKGGYHGVRWGLIWTFCLWLVVLYCNKKNIYWKL